MLGFSPLASSPLAASADGAVSVSVDLTGVSATGNLGTVAVDLQLDVTLTGVNATGQIGSPIVQGDAIIPLGGWGAGSWGDNPWGQNSLGVQAVGQVGSVTVGIGVDVDVRGFKQPANLAQ